MSSGERKRIHCLRPLVDVSEPLPSEALPSVAGRTSGAMNGSSGGAMAAAITEAVVVLLRARTGRGPTRAKTAISSDLAIVTLGECLTTAEKTLADEGHGALASRIRAALHDGMRAEAVAAVEAITHRQVAAYLTAHQHEPDLAVIAFHFSPSPGLKGLR